MTDEQDHMAVRALDFVRPAGVNIPLEFEPISKAECAKRWPAPRQQAASNAMYQAASVMGAGVFAKIASRVQDGPAYQYEPGDDVTPFQYPFAYRLWRHLDRNGAVCAYQAGDYKHGSAVLSGPVGSDRLVHLWEQRHTSLDEPEALGDKIMEQFGKHITFGEMILPEAQGGIDWCGFQRAKGVWVRHLGMYYIGADAMIQCWDVLVRKT
jgi:hypothetical protein